MKEAIKTGLGFGLTSGVITPMGLMIGLNTGTGSSLAVIGGILTIAFADALADGLGIHMAEEANKRNSHRHVWMATITAFLAKLLIALSFLVALLIAPLSTAVIINIVWGILLLIMSNIILAKQRGEKIFNVLKHHLILMLAVIIIAHLIGKMISIYFG